MSPPTALAFLAGCLGALAVADAAATLAGPLERWAARLGRRTATLARALGRPAREGRHPATADRRRLAAAVAAAALVAGTLLAGPGIGLLAAVAAPVALMRTLAARRERYRQAVASGAAQVATALADALGAGHSVRGAVIEAAPGVEGPAGNELRRAAGELVLGARTEEALERLRARAASPEIDAVVAGVLLQRRAGGDLARLLRESARAFEDQARLRGEANAATAQARFTGVVVILMPLGGALLAELASPGFASGLLDGFLTAWLVGLALLMQAAAAIIIRRLGRVRE